ncbi:hypothetical protein BDV95DRAFT_603493 [Massariosphaeria phaeospora]|uniref:Aminoglycoside phosphotransferase domain-containing protein n=1 Tax=Massariosphaeria phaeospora TaxID=100035 RepID=A0A7C8IF29_9PLEO|nr:hypothetical protein BDV95DRAFT_603493 [Massariosphaeria phaeospora]
MPSHSTTILVTATTGMSQSSTPEAENIPLLCQSSDAKPKGESIDTSQGAHTVVESETKTQSAASKTSTLLYSQEPFETFQGKVSGLCLTKFGPKTFSIERIKGGSYNRIIGITIRSPRPKKWSWLWARTFLAQILRAYNLATIRFALTHLSHALPAVFAADITAENLLGAPYQIQQRLPGQNFGDIFETLKPAQKQCVVRLLVGILTDIRDVTSTAAGVISSPNIEYGESSASTVSIDKFRVGYRNPPRIAKFIKPETWSASPETTLEFLLEQCNRWKEFEQTNWEFAMPLWSKFKKIAHALHGLGFIPDTDRFHCCHLDLRPRNILVDVIDDATVKITGLLDWDADFAHFCPKFVAYGSPFWLWIADEDYEWDETRATEAPSDPGKQQLKQLFEDLASAEWIKYAFTPEYIIARRMFAILRDGIRSNNDSDDADDIVATWQKMHYDKALDVDVDSDEELEDVSTDAEDSDGQ